MILCLLPRNVMLENLRGRQRMLGYLRVLCERQCKIQKMTLRGVRTKFVHFQIMIMVLSLLRDDDYYIIIMVMVMVMMRRRRMRMRMRMADVFGVTCGV